MTEYDIRRECETYRNRLVEKYPILRDTRFVVNTRCRARAGQAKLHLNVVEISAFFFVGRPENEKDMHNTILHEIAHIVAYALHRDRGHGLAWRSIARQIGCTGDRCHTMKRGDEITVACPCGRFSREISERKCRMWHRKGRAVQCPGCKKFIPFPWERPLIAHPPMPTRSIFQRG